MKIKKSETYKVDLFEEPHAKSDHERNFTKTLTFTGSELIGAIISAGMPDVYLTKHEKRSRREEILFKIKLFETFVKSSSKGKLSFDTSRRAYLDSTEIGAINYWIGMVLITVLGQKKYNYEFMVHLSMVKLFSEKIDTEKRPFVIKGKKVFKSPDLLAINVLEKKYGVFESKGYTDYNKKAMESGYTQAKSIKSINGYRPENCLVVMTQTGGNEIRMIEKDPEGENVEINIDLDFLYLYHFLPIAELITELQPDEYEGRVSGYLEYDNNSYSISIPGTLYKELSRTIDSGVWNPDDSSIYESLFDEASVAAKDREKILYVE